jgi:uncharacterized protein YjbJ (UPF0337 family)
MSMSALAFPLQLDSYHAALPPRRPLMGVTDKDKDRPDDSNEPRHKPDSLREETSATGQRIKGAAKEAVGDIADDRGMEKKGERENAAGKDRQRKNDGA